MSEETITTEQISVKPCRKCGAQDRNKQGGCRPCQLLAVKRYQSKNPERVKFSAKKYYDGNRNKRIAAALAWNRANPDKFKEHARKSSHNWYLANLDRCAEQRHKYYKANMEKVQEYSRKYYEDNREQAAERNRKWAKANPEKIKVKKHNRRARVKGNGGKLSPDIVKTLMTLQKGKCACCGKSLKQGYHLDHIMPIALGGKNTDDNVQLLTPKCNLRKSDKHPDDWARLNGRLI